ncbi:hypothetical protein [Rubellimicrobium roseum]|nr:hypothetical protein [Rubellimicrobium roseum]
MIQGFLSRGPVGEAALRHCFFAFDGPGLGYSDRPRVTVWTQGAEATS